jgi:hypothetical protein
VKIITESNTAEGRAMAGIAVVFLGECVNTADLKNALDRIDARLVDCLADRLLEGADWDAYDWTG